ncbi:hypothetical protein ACFVYT_39865 [Streptomyces sp. NPDC058290]|uniref:hypothetical protein n=1 Tax=Streptomyces sp. NPDC058290 TaxID=3346426 RepID=UPI0036E18A7E
MPDLAQDECGLLLAPRFAVPVLRDRVGAIFGGAPSCDGAWIVREGLEDPALEDQEQLRSLLRVLLRNTARRG